MCKLSLAKNVRVIIGMVMCFAMTACSQGNQISYPTNNDFSTVYSQMDMQYSIYRYTYETNIQEDGIMLNRIGESGLDLGIYGDSVVMYPKERYRETMTQDNDNFKWDNLIKRYKFSGYEYDRRVN